MSAPENFLRRWSRRKREAAAAPKRADAAKPDTAETPESSSDAVVAPTAAPRPAPPTVDLTRLPPVESITATTDVSGYLAPGVPPELTRAALRRAWLADPAIRDFVGLAENQWDFTAPHGAPGFGALAEDEARRLVAELLGETEATPGAPASVAAMSDQGHEAQVSAIAPQPSPAQGLQDDSRPGEPAGAAEAKVSTSDRSAQLPDKT